MSRPFRLMALVAILTYTYFKMTFGLYTTEAETEAQMKHVFGIAEYAYVVEECWIGLLEHTPVGLTPKEIEEYEPGGAKAKKLTCSPAWQRVQLTATGTGTAVTEKQGKLTFTTGSGKVILKNANELTLIKEITAEESPGFKAEYWVLHRKSTNASDKVLAWGAVGSPPTLTKSTWPVKVPPNNLEIKQE